MDKFGIGPQGPRIAVAIMAAGKGTRLKSQLPKVLHEVGGKPLLEHVIRAAVRLVPAKDVYAIIGHEAERVRAAMAAYRGQLCAAGRAARNRAMR